MSVCVCVRACILLYYVSRVVGARMYTAVSVRRGESDR